MNKVTLEAWIDALRSGEYKQGHRILREPERGAFCCLGVLCDLVDPDAWSGKAWRKRGYVAAGYDLPWDLLLEDVPDDINARELAALNDDGGFTFDEIADYLEDRFVVDTPDEV